MIRSVKPSDAPNIVSIYNHYIANTTITFEEDPVSEDDMKGRIQESIQSDLPWLIAEKDGEIIGYAYASKWKGRCAYRYSVEVTVYLSKHNKAKGWGSKLYDALFATLKESSIHSIIAGIALPNPSSIALHEKFGMEQVAHFKEVGYKFDQWVDVGYWQVNFSSE